MDAMNTEPVSVWWIAPQAGQGTYGLQSLGGGYTQAHTTAWSEGRNTSAFLLSMDDPNTRCIIALPKGEPLTGEQVPELVWAAWLSSPDRVHGLAASGEAMAIHTELLGLKARVEVVACDQPERALAGQEPLYHLLGREEWKVLHQQGSHLAWARVIAPFVWNGSARWSMARMWLSVSILAFAGVLHCGLSLHSEAGAEQFQNDLRRLNAIQAPPAEMTFTPQPWTEAYESLARFGRNDRANIDGLHWSWSHHTPIQALVTLNRDRARIPKGCVPISTDNPSSDTVRHTQAQCDLLATPSKNAARRTR